MRFLHIRVVKYGMELAPGKTHFLSIGRRFGGWWPSGPSHRIADEFGQVDSPERVFGPYVSQT